MSENNTELIKALIEEPSIYVIDVVDNSMLPKHLKNNKKLTFVIKPPTLEVLAKCSISFFKIPEKVRNSKELKIEDSLKYVNEIVEVLCVLAGKKGGVFPKWYPEFFTKNLKAKELYMLFYESSLKMGSTFFLNSFQIVKQNNPMIIS